MATLQTEITRILRITVKLLKILIAQKKAEPFPGWQKTISRIRAVAKKYNVNPDLAVNVATCESNLDPQAVRINTDGSIDRGIFQWNNIYHPEVSNECAFNIECSTKYFCQAVLAGNIYWWNASKHCWS